MTTSSTPAGAASSPARDAAATLRTRVKDAGIRARVRITPGTRDGVQVFVPAFGMTFTDQEQRTVRRIALDMGLTLVQGLPIDVERMTDPRQFDFYLA